MLQVDDRVVIFETRGNEGLEFVSVASVLAVSRADQDKSEFQKIVLSEPDPLPESRNLREVAGSLRKVYRFLAPERHFARPITKIPRLDFETIRTGILDEERTTFRYLFSALPFELQTDFLTRYGVDGGVNQDGIVRDYARLSRSIVEYYQADLTECLHLFEWCSTAFAQLDGTRNLPPLRELRLTGPEGQESAIPIGEIVEALSGMTENNGLFSESVAGRALLSEAKSRLDALQSGQALSSELNRRQNWNEMIF